MNATLQRQEPRSLSLYEIETELIEAFAAVQQAQETGNTDDEAAALDVCQAYLLESSSKRDRCGKFLESIAANARAVQAEIDRLKFRLESIEAARRSFCGFIQGVMLATGQDKLKGELFTFALRRNPPQVQIDDEMNLPPEYLKVPDPPAPKPDKRAIKEDLEAGVEIPGCRLIQTRRLDIR